MPKKPVLDAEAVTLRNKKAAHIAEEMLVLACTLVGIVISQAFGKRKEGLSITFSDFFLDWPNLLVSVAIALIYYGSLYTNFKDVGTKKPPLAKRVSTALLTGVAWRTLTNF
jgi:hypothetical protein